MRVDELDPDGYLGTPDAAMGATFAPVVDRCADTLVAEVAGLHALFLYGSIARGTAVAGRSDLDLLAVLDGPDAGDRCGAVARDLTERHRALVTEVAVATITTDALHADGVDAWADRAFLRHGCTLLRGPDLRLDLPRQRPTARLAWAYNRHTGEMLDALRRVRVDGAALADVVQRASRRALLGLTSVASARSGTWTTHRPVAVAWLADTVPALGPLAHDALRWCREPIDDPGALRAVLEDLGPWVVAQLDAVGAEWAG